MAAEAARSGVAAAGSAGLVVGRLLCTAGGTAVARCPRSLQPGARNCHLRSRLTRIDAKKLIALCLAPHLRPSPHLQPRPAVLLL
eukprot:6190407-Pleurochrysis_carterae.AAC.2